MGWLSIGAGLVSSFLGKKAEKKAAGQSMAGFNYLKANEGVKAAQTSGQQAGGLISGLFGLGGDQQASEDAFSAYRDSTGYQFRMDQGMDAITGNAAASGLLNSGATVRGATRFGQQLASDEFSNYLAQLGNIQSTGLSAAYNTASQGTSGGAGAAESTWRGAEEVSAGLATAAGGAMNVYNRMKLGG